MNIDFIMNGRKTKKTKQNTIFNLFNNKPRKKSNNFMSLFTGKGIGIIGDKVTKPQRACLNKRNIFCGFSDFDKDGVINGLDCAPRNKRKHMAFKKETGFPFAEHGWDERYRVTDREISPTTYLKLAKKTSEVYNPSTKEMSQQKYEDELYKKKSNIKSGLKQAIQSNEPVVDRPFIETKHGKLYDHEGRHRAFFAREAGIKKIPVRFVESTESEEMSNEEYGDKVDLMVGDAE